MNTLLFYGCLFAYFLTRVDTFKTIRFKLKKYPRFKSISTSLYSNSLQTITLMNLSNAENSGFSNYITNFNNKLNLTSFSGCDMRFIDINITKLVNGESTVDKMINESSNLTQEKQDIANIKKYMAMNNLLSVLSSSDYSNIHKTAKIDNSTFFPFLSKDTQGYNITKGGLMDDWYWDIE
jgi:hypothetical protein